MAVQKLDTPIFGPIPPFPRHAITIHLPGWEYLLRFMERDMTLIKQFKSFYPRIKLHPDVLALNAEFMKKSGIEEHMGFPFPSKETAEECIAWATSPARPDPPGHCTPEELQTRLYSSPTTSLWMVFCPMPKFSCAVPFWQNSGMGISSRLAEDCLKSIDEFEEIPLPTTTFIAKPFSESPSHQIIRERIAGLMNRAPAGPPREKTVEADDVYLFQTGMSGIYSVHKYITRKHNEKTVLFGFAFHATPHVFEDFGPGYKFFGNGDTNDLELLETFLKEEKEEGRKIQALWTEIPSNPVLQSPDLARLRELADEYGFLLLVDDTVASFCNVDVLSVADIVATSLTKSFSGYADVMASSAVLNPNSARYEELKTMMTSNFSNVFYSRDADILETNSRDYLSRSNILNANALKLVTYLQTLVSDPTSSVKKVHYPTTSNTLGNYQKYMRKPTPDFEPGYGCLFSLELDSEEATAACYDNLHVHQGPHLGAHLTLAMAYVKGIYGKETEKYKQFGVNERQLRVSVGLEDGEELVEVFKHALSFADALKTNKRKIEEVSS